jgi:hypothetical protein
LKLVRPLTEQEKVHKTSYLTCFQVIYKRVKPSLGQALLVQTAFGIGALKEKKETDLETCLPRKLTLATPFSKPRSCLANSSYNPDFAPARPLAGGSSFGSRQSCCRSNPVELPKSKITNQKSPIKNPKSNHPYSQIKLTT